MKLKDLIKPQAPPVPPGPHPCVCFGVVDFGKQLAKIDNKYHQRIRFFWEVSDVTDAEGKPVELSREFTATFDKRGSLHGFLSGWLGIADSEETLREIDVSKLIGVPSLMSVVLSENGSYSNIASVSPLLSGYPAPQLTRTPVLWIMEQWNDAVFQTLPKWIQERIKKSQEYQNAHPPTTTIDFAALSASQARQPAAPAVQPAQPVQQYAAPVVQQAAPVTQPAQVVQQTAPQPVQTPQAVYTSAPAAPGAVNPQAYQMTYQAGQTAQQPVITPSAPVVQPSAQGEEAPF